MQSDTRTAHRPIRCVLDLGATLYMPAHHADALAVANAHKYPELKTQVFCTEDAVAENEVPLALEQLRFNLPRLENAGPHCFVRPRNPEVLETILKMDGVGKLHGFILPKTDSASLPAWFRILSRHERFWLMPTLETRSVFDSSAMRRFRDELAESPLRERVLALRFGALDLLGLLSLRREAERSIYESPLGHVIDQLICTFRPAGLALTAPGYECLANQSGLADELSRDVGRGLFGKTALHPAQIQSIHRAYQVAPSDLETSRALVDPERPAVFRLHGRMCEKAVHTSWARAILKRAELYGLANHPLKKERIMLDKFMNWVKDTSTTLAADVKKFKNKSFMEAVVAGCAVVAASDGSIAPEEKRKMIGFINQNEALKIFDTGEAIKLFEKYTAAYEFDAEVGKGQALKVIGQLKGKQGEARLMIRVCCAIGAADGNFDEYEKNAVREICRELGQDPSEFNL